LDLNNRIISNHVLSPTQENLTAKMKKAKVSKINVSTKESFKTLDVTSNTPESEGNITAVVSKEKYQATES
jgi:hypothetical protein